MKRVLAWVLVLTLCLGLFAGCKKKDNNETPNNDNVVSSVADLEAALEYIKTVYKKVGEKTPKDFQRIGNVPVNGKNYEVIWTADVGEEYIKVVKGNDGMVTIDVKEDVDKEVKYVLTATISDDAGNSVSHSWNHLLPVAGNMASIVEEAYLLEPGASMGYEVTLTGKITAINTPWDAGYKNITVTIIVEGAEDKPIMCYRLAGEGADKLKPNDIITVTGTIKNYNGTIEFDAGCTLDAVIEGEEIKAPTDPKQIIAEAYALAENGALPYKATLTGVISKVNTEYNPGYKNVTVTMIVDGDKDHPIQCYRLAGDGADKIDKGDTITVTGWIVNYKGTVQFGQGCTLDSWKDTGANVPKPEDTFTTTLVPEIVTEPQAGVAYKFFMYQKNYGKNFYLTGNMDGYYYETTYDPAKAVDVYLEEVSGGWRAYFMKDGVKNYLEMAVSGTHKNVIFVTNPTKALKWNDEIDTITCDLTFEGENKYYYWGTYSFYKTFSASDVARVTGSDADLETNFVAHFATMKETAVEEKSAAEIAFEALKEEYFVASDTATATAENYTRKNVYDVEGTKVNVVWTENSDAVEIVDNGDGTVTVKVTRGTEDAPYTLTATITDGDKSFTTSWECVVPAVPPVSAKDIVNAAYQLEPGEAMADQVTLSGIISNIDTAYSEQYGNITVTIIVEEMMDKPIMCFRLKGEGIADLQVFDNITVTGTIKNYNGTIEFDAGCTLDACMTMAEIVDATYALESGKALEEKYTLVGVITSVDTPYSEQYGNVTVTIAVPGCEDKPIKCYRLKGTGAEELDVGYIVAVYGTLKNYNGTYEFDQGCVLVDSGAPEGPEVEIPTLSIPEANELGAAQTSGYTDNYKVTGTIVEIKNETYGNMYIADAAGNKLYIYGLNDAEGVRYDAMEVKPVVGDVITVVGGLGQYNGDPQMKNAVLDTHIQVLSIEAANALGAGLTADTTTWYQVSGTVTEIKNSTYGNLYIQDESGATLYVYGTYSADGSTRFDAMEQKPAVGDYITVYGVMSQYNGAPQMKNGRIVDHRVVVSLSDATTIGEGVANNATTPIKYQLSGTVTEIKNSTYGNLYIQDAAGNQFYIYGLYDAIGNLRFDAMETKPAVGDYITVYGALSQYNGSAQMKNGWLLDISVPTVEPDPDVPANTTVSVNIGEYASANSWTDATQYSTVVMDENITVTATGTTNTGKYYVNGTNWRIYQTENPTVKIEAAAGNIVSVKVTYAQNKNGVLTLNGSNIASGSLVEVNAASVTFGVGNTGTATNGQVRITAIEVVYAAETGETEPATSTVSVSMGEYASANSWADATMYSTVVVDENVTVTATGTTNTGKYYVNGNNWRIYQSENPSVKVESTAGNIVSVKITYDQNKNGVLTLNGSNITSGSLVEVNTASVTFGVGNTGTATNGQVRITAIEVTYATAASGGSGEGGSETPEPIVPTLPETDGAEVSIADALAYAATMEHNTYTDKKYNVTGEIVEVYNTQYGNMRIKDAEGKILTIYGSYSADGSIGYASMETKPAAGDTVTIYGKIGQYNGTPQIKNGWIVDHVKATPVYPGAEAITNVVYTYGNTSAYSNVIINWGRRGYDATFLSPNATTFYSDNNVTYEELAALAGASDVNAVPSSALYTTLQELMESNQTKQTTYGETRELYRYTDCQDQIDSYGISCFYSGNTLGPAWDSGNTWNREHCWPKSKSNATWNSDNTNSNTGELGDLMTLRPVQSNINSSRSNKAYGISDGYYNPNSSTSMYDLRGDVARIVLYTYVRWEDSAHMWGTDGVIENVEVLLDWMEADPVDTWEMGRNDSVESVTGTRNVFVDYPELAFILFGEEVPNITTPSGKAAA